MYLFIKKILFSFDPELSHAIAMKSLQLAYRCKLTPLFAAKTVIPVTVMGLNFPNKVGLAAGLDSNGDYIDALAALGFGFIEVGGVTPKPQQGNPQPRLFRLVEQEGLINRMGFCNKGVDYLANNLAKMKFRGILGVNITKNRDTSNENAIDDYLFCMRALWRYANYFTINVSSPNTPGLRVLQQIEFLNPLLAALKHEQNIIQNDYHKYVPLVVKLSPDLSAVELKDVADVLLANKIDGVIATNTSVDRQRIADVQLANEAGGLSGRPLSARSTEVIRELHSHLGGNIPIIASGGVMDAATAQEKIDAGASLLQVYTGFIYGGPGIIRELAG